MSKPTMTITADFTKQFNEIIKGFKGDAVLVGIPAENSKRDDDSTINNATILAINNFGSPGQNIEPRPVMEIGIRNAQDAIAEQFKLAAKNALSQGIKALDTYYGRAGMIASNSIKKAINDQDGIKEPAKSTIRARRARGFMGKSALIVTGQMRNAITYVVKGKA